MMKVRTVIRPALHLGTLQPSWPLLNVIANGLGNLCASDEGDLLGFALGHGVGARYIGGACSEYLCAFVGTGDRRSVDGAVFQLRPAARAVINSLNASSLLNGTMARAFRETLSSAGPEFETVHFRDFTVAILYDDTTGKRCVSDIRLFATPAQGAFDAERRIVEIRAIFQFLGECHDTLNRYRFDMPTPDKLRRGA
jgi:hypothetical protein